MPWFDLIWDDANEAHIAEHGLTVDDVINAINDPIDEFTSRSSGRPMIEGYALDGRVIVVSFEYLDEISIYPITAYEVE